MEKNKKKPNNIMSKCKVRIRNYSDLTLDLKPTLKMINQEKRDKIDQKENKEELKTKKLKNQKKKKVLKRKNKKINLKKKAPK